MRNRKIDDLIAAQRKNFKFEDNKENKPVIKRAFVTVDEFDDYVPNVEPMEKPEEKQVVISRNYYKAPVEQNNVPTMQALTKKEYIDIREVKMAKRKKLLEEQNAAQQQVVEQQQAVPEKKSLTIEEILRKRGISLGAPVASSGTGDLKKEEKPAAVKNSVEAKTAAKPSAKRLVRRGAKKTPVARKKATKIDADLIKQTIGNADFGD